MLRKSESRERGGVDPKSVGTENKTLLVCMFAGGAQMEAALSEDIEFAIVSSLRDPDTVLPCRLVSKRWKGYIGTAQLIETFSYDHHYVRFLFSILLFQPFAKSCHITLFSDVNLYSTLYTIVFKMAAVLTPVPSAQEALYEFVFKANAQMRQLRSDVDKQHIARYLSHVFRYLDRFYAARLSLPPLLGRLLTA